MTVVVALGLLFVLVAVTSDRPTRQCGNCGYHRDPGAHTCPRCWTPG